MSVYKPSKSPFYHYDFQLQGYRFHGSTGLTAKRAAERFEEDRREEAEQKIETAKKQGSEPMTFAVAAGRFYHEVGRYHAGEGAKNTRRALMWLRGELGETILLSDISDGLVAEVVARRRAYRAKGSERTVTNATVNRSCTEPLRKVINRARDVWGQTVQNIRWDVHMLSEPKERTRELSADEETKLDGAIREDYLPLYRFAVLTGLRMSECLRLTWPDIDWGARLIRVHGKGGKVAAIPLEPDVRDLLFPLQGRHESVVFCYRAARAAPGRARGSWLPITLSGLKTRWRRDRARSGIKDYRWHDHRHTAATRVLRASGNLKAVQKLLRHSDIATTTKYAHVTDDDLRAALNSAAISRTKSRTALEVPNQDIDKIEGNGN